MHGTGWLAATVAVGRRPALWLTAARQVRRLARRGWWRRLPFLPLPDRGWLRFRALTQYGDPRHAPDGDDVVAWLVWVRDADAGRVRTSRNRIHDPVGGR